MQLTSRKSPTIVGLDIESGSVAATEVVYNGTARPGRTGIAPLPPGVSREGEISDPQALGSVLKELFGEQKLPRQVRVGVANQRVVVRTLRMPTIEKPDELESAIRFQAQDQIPMPLDTAVLDWQVVAQGVGEGGRQMDVVVVAARRDMVNMIVEALSVANLRPVGIDLSAFGMIRALAAEAPTLAEAGVASGEHPPAEQEQRPAQLYCNLGDITTLAVARGQYCLFTRVSSFGLEGIAQRLAERRGLTLEHSRQWLAHVGLERPVESIDGDAEVITATREVLAEGASKLGDELRLSLEFYGAQPDAVRVEEIVVCGPGTMIEGLAGRLERELGLALRLGRPSALAHLEDASAARLTLSYGLALEQ